MNSKLIKGLALAAAALLAAVIALVIMQRPRQGPTPFARALEAERITLQTGPTRIELEKDGALWQVSSSSPPVRYRADADKIKNAQNALKAIRVEDMISERAEGAGDFEADAASGVVVSLWGKQAESLGEGIFGKPVAGSPHTYFRYPNRPDVYLARGSIRMELGPPLVNAWRDPALLNVSEDHMLTLLVEAPGVKVALARSSHTWSLNGREIDPVSVYGTLGLLAHLKAEEFVDLTQRPDLAPDKLLYASLHVQLQDGTTHQLRLGKMDAATKRYPAAVDADQGSAWVSEPTVKQFLRKPSEYKSASPSPTASSGK